MPWTKVVNGVTVTVSDADIRAAHPNTSFPSPIPDNVKFSLGLTKTVEDTTVPLTERKARRWDDVKFKRARVEYGGILCNGHWFQTDAESLQKLMNNKFDAALKMLDGGTRDDALMANGEQMMWKTEDNGLVPVTVGLALDIGVAIKDHVAATYKRAEVLRFMIDNSTDPEAIDIEAGWPATFADTLEPPVVIQA